MWLLHFLPDSFLQFIVHAILIVGVVGCFLSFFVINRLLMAFPPFASYYKTAQIVSVVLLVAGIYFEGGYAAEKQWRERVAEVEQKLAAAEQASTELNTRLNTAGQQRIKVIRGQTQVVRQYIDREVVRYDTKFLPGGQCEIPQEFIQAHNKSAERTK